MPITVLVKRPIDLIVLLLKSILSLIMLFIQLILKFLVSILLLVLLLRIGIYESPLGPSILSLELIELIFAKGALLCSFIQIVLLLHLPFLLRMILLHHVQLLFVSILHQQQRGIVFTRKFI